MKRRILAIAMLAAAVSGCSNRVSDGSTNVRMTVEARQSKARRFWVTLVDDVTGERTRVTRLSGKRCRNGPENFHPGESIMVSFDLYRDEETGIRTREIDEGDLDRRFC